MTKKANEQSATSGLGNLPVEDEQVSVFVNESESGIVATGDITEVYDSEDPSRQSLRLDLDLSTAIWGQQSKNSIDNKPSAGADRSRQGPIGGRNRSAIDLSEQSRQSDLSTRNEQSRGGRSNAILEERTRANREEIEDLLDEIKRVDQQHTEFVEAVREDLLRPVAIGVGLGFLGATVLLATSLSLLAVPVAALCMLFFLGAWTLGQ